MYCNKYVNKNVHSVPLVYYWFVLIFCLGSLTNGESQYLSYISNWLTNSYFLAVTLPHKHTMAEEVALLVSKRETVRTLDYTLFAMPGNILHGCMLLFFKCVSKRYIVFMSAQSRILI